MNYKIIVLSLLIVVLLLYYLNKQNKQNIPMYCIYIPKRENSIKQLFENLDMDVTFIPGVDKDKINIPKLVNEKKIIPWGVENTGRIACHYSHLNVIKEFLKSGEDRCIIFEDDLYCDYSKQMVSNVLTKTFDNLPDDCDILYLGYCWESCKHMSKVNPYILNAYSPRCRHAYSINRRAAKILLDKTSIMYNNGDEMYNNLIMNGTLKAYLASVVLFEQNRGYFGSELNNNHPLRKCV